MNNRSNGERLQNIYNSCLCTSNGRTNENESRKKKERASDVRQQANMSRVVRLFLARCLSCALIVRTAETRSAATQQRRQSRSGTFTFFGCASRIQPCLGRVHADLPLRLVALAHPSATRTATMHHDVVHASRDVRIAIAHRQNLSNQETNGWLSSPPSLVKCCHS